MRSRAYISLQNRRKMGLINKEGLKNTIGVVNYMSEVAWPDPFAKEDKASKK